MNKNLKDRADRLLQSIYLDGYEHGYKDALKSIFKEYEEKQTEKSCLNCKYENIKDKHNMLPCANCLERDMWQPMKEEQEHYEKLAEHYDRRTKND